MSCVLEVYDIVKQRGTSCVMVHTNLGYIHYYDDPSVLRYTSSDWRGLLKVITWQLWPIVYSKVRRKARYDSWLRDGPPECVKR